MSIYSLPPLISSVLFLGLGYFALLKSQRKRQAIFGFFLNCFVTFWWQFSWVLLFNTQNEVTARLLIKIGYSGIIFIPATFLHFFVNYFEESQSKRIIQIYYGIGFVFLALLWMTDMYIDGYYQYFFGYYPKAGMVHPIYLIYLCGVVMHCFWKLFLMGRKLNWEGQTANQIKFLLISFSIYSLAASDFVINYGVEYYPLGIIPISICLGTITYAVLKYNLMDIRIVFKQSLVYTILISLITVLFFIFIYLVEGVLREIVGYHSFIVSLISATTIAVVFIPLRNAIQTFIDRLFFKGSYIQIAEQNELLRQEITQRDRYRMIANLTNNIVNEIKSPLTVMTGYLHHLKSKQDDKEFINKCTNVLEAEVKKMSGLLQHLSGYSNPAPLEVKDIDIYRLIDNTLLFLKTTSIEKNVKIVKKFNPTNSLNLRIDADQIRQALLNVLVNGLEAMEDGGELYVSTEQFENQFRITIRDTGKGMLKEDLSRIFDPFFSTKKEHTGLGLAIAQGIIESHKGRIRVKSRERIGTEIILELPLFDPLQSSAM